MRIQRIHLRDFRGVEDSEVVFAPQGVTIVEGPNEVGKTSMCDALTMVLEHLDSSGRGEIRDAKPVHKDAGPWVEAELTTGQYHLIIEKRWLRSPMTHLRVLAPRAEELTGREAHERLREILAETLDQQLFAALHYLQGVDISQAALGGSVSLAAALDAAASGESLAGARETGLLDRVRDERLRYFTPGGRPNAERTQRSERLASLRARQEELAAQIAALDELAEQHRSETAELGRLRAELADAKLQLNAATRDWDAVQEARRLAGDASGRHQAALAAAAEAARRQGEREVQVRAEVEALAQRERAAAAVDALRPALAAADTLMQLAAAQRDSAREERRQAATARGRAQDDHEFARRTISRQLWSERLARVRAGQHDLAASARLLAENHVDDQRLAEIEAASSGVTAARARLSTASASVNVTALDAVAVRVGARTQDLDAGQELSAHVDDELTLEIGGIARVTVTGGTPELALKQAADTAQQRFADLLAETGLAATATIAECRLAAQERRDAVGRAERARQVIAEGLRDLSVDRLEQEVADDDEYLHAYAIRYGTPAQPVDLEAAAARLDAAQRTLDAALAADDAAGRAYEDASARLTVAQRGIADAEAELRVAAALHGAATDALRLARDQHDDAELARQLAASREAVARTADALERATATLAGLDPDSVEARRANLDGVVSRLALTIQHAEQQLVASRTELALRGEEGLHDRLADVQTEAARLSTEHDRVERAARAVEMLWNRLETARDAAKRSYVAPYRAEIERLGRIVYGPTFGVDIDHSDLTITSRTLGGRTVPFGRLSTGAREQLCVLALLACAGIVAGGAGHGVPVIIDDALGWTDHDRLERIGAAFASAGRSAQVIVLTCDPARYRTVGSAHVRRLRAAAATGRTEG